MNQSEQTIAMLAQGLLKLPEVNPDDVISLLKLTLMVANLKSLANLSMQKLDAGVFKNA